MGERVKNLHKEKKRRKMRLFLFTSHKEERKEEKTIRKKPDF